MIVLARQCCYIAKECSVDVYVTKASGEQELFNIEKFRRSLRRVGASEEIISHIARDIEVRQDLRSTRDIYRYALGYLKQEPPGLAARYATKKALFELGPAGFPFERFVAELFKDQGYAIQLDQMRRGYCVEHEIDVIARTDHKHLIVECKFHNGQYLKTDVKAALALKARFDDLVHAAKQDRANTILYEPWLVTNTKFTTQAIQFGECAGIRLLGWGYPLENSLPALIDRHKLYPVTALTTLNYSQKAELIRQGCVLCKDMCVTRERLKAMGLGEKRVERVVQEAQQICSANHAIKLQ